MVAKSNQRAAGWFAIQSLPQRESVALQNLERQGFHAFYPRYRKTRRHARRVNEVLVPVFPGYLFAQFNPLSDPWHSIKGTLGVKCLVGGTPSSPQRMPDAVMEALLARCSDGIMLNMIDALQEGQAVRIVAGPLANQIAQLERLDGRGRVRVLLDILGGSTSLQLPISNVVPA